MGCFAPIEESLDLVLEREDDPDSSIISTELSLPLSPCVSVTYLALNRRKFCVIKGKLNAGRLGSIAAALSPASTASLSLFSSTGNICCKNLQRVCGQPHERKEATGKSNVVPAYLVNRRSCIERPEEPDLWC